MFQYSIFNKENIINSCHGKSWIIRFPLVLFLLYIFYQHLFNVEYFGLLDNFNLLIHEAGHLIFMPFGKVMSILGGTLLQLIFPLAFLFSFLSKNEFFGASFCLAWLAENLFGVATYIADAQLRLIPLLNGDINSHDWYNLLNIWGIIKYNGMIAGFVKLVAVIFMTTAIIFASWLLWEMFKKKNQSQGLEDFIYKE